ncbi:MAG TPA: 2TM domain-containing protein [Acidimicrobiia bacterium]|jgi:hypothetical protein
MTNEIEVVETSSEHVTESDMARRRARERAEMIQGLYIHLLVFAVINAGLFLTNWLTRGEDGTWWFVWPLLIWGIGLMIHVLVVVAPVFSPQWVDRKVDEMTRKT